MVSQLGLLDGITAIGVLTSSILCGSLSIYKAKKLDAKLLYAAGLAMIFSGLLFLGPTIDLILILATKKNISPIYLYGILSYMWVAISVLPTMYLGAELIIPKKASGFVASRTLNLLTPKSSAISCSVSLANSLHFSPS